MYGLYREYRYAPYQYIKYGLYRRDFSGDIRDYFPPELIHKYRDSLNPPDARFKASDKIVFEALMAEHDVPYVKTLLIIGRDGTIATPEGMRVQKSDFTHVLGELNSSARFFLKPYNGGSGKNIHQMLLLDKQVSLDGQVVNMGKLYDSLFKNNNIEKFILQPRIEQHKVLSDLNPDSVNSIRLDTLVLDGDVVSNCAFLRVGAKGSFVDNLSKGGFFVRIDLQSGILDKYGHSKGGFGSAIITRHPVSGLSFEGLEIPFWDELKSQLTVAAHAMRPLCYLGWDIAITRDGPIIIETNHDFAAFSCQYAAGGLRKMPVGDEIVKFLNKK
jgi:glutathione synthase/RimK-type ligase-like ATP-grasp enzyme